MAGITVFVDVRNTISVPFTSGIQRVTRELLARAAASPAPGPRFVPVVACRACGGWRRLTSVEADRLCNGSVTRGPEHRAPGVGRLHTLSSALAPRAMHRIARGLRERIRHHCSHAGLSIGKLPPGSIFLDMDSSWHNAEDRESLLAELNRGGTVTAAMHYDLGPISSPQHFLPETRQLFERHLEAHVRHSAAMICCSRHCADELQRYIERSGAPPHPRISTVTLGADIGPAPEGPPATPSARSLPRYILCVGTLQPRKNQAALLHAFHELAPSRPDLGLIFIGTTGWMAEGFLREMKSSRYFGHRVFHESNVDDSELQRLYQRALVTVVPSLHEGFGLPVLEALAAGCPVISSDAGALPEVGGSAVCYVPANDGQALADALRLHADDRDFVARRRREIRRMTLPAWDDTLRRLITVLAGVQPRAKRDAA